MYRLFGEKQMTYNNTTFCASSGCTNECGKKITQEQIIEANELGLQVSWGYFCGTPDNVLYRCFDDHFIK